MVGLKPRRLPERLHMAGRFSSPNGGSEVQASSSAEFLSSLDKAQVLLLADHDLDDLAGCIELRRAWPLMLAGAYWDE